MTVSELKAILDTLPDDMPVLINRELQPGREPRPPEDYAPEFYDIAPGLYVRTGLGERQTFPALIIIPLVKSLFDGEYSQ